MAHLKFKSRNKIRDVQDQYIRLKNIHLAPEIIKNSKTLQEIRREKEFVQIRTNKRKERKLKDVIYYGFIAIISINGTERRLKIIVKEIVGGQKHFWSIIPFWKKNKQKIKMDSGNLKED